MPVARPRGTVRLSHQLYEYAGPATEDGGLSVRAAHPACGGGLDSIRRTEQQVLRALCSLGLGSPTVAGSSRVVCVSDSRGVDGGAPESEGRSGQTSTAGHTGGRRQEEDAFDLRLERVRRGWHRGPNPGRKSNETGSD